MKNLTIAIVIFNEKKKLSDFLQALQKEVEACPSLINVLFIDNHSTDSSCEIIKEWQKQNPSISSKIINRTKNHMAEARQQALVEAKTEFVVFLDGDCFVIDGWMKGIQKAIADWPETQGACGGPSPYSDKEEWHKFAISLAQLFPWGVMGSKKKKVNHMPTCNYLVHRNRALEVGGFHSFFEKTGEDLDFNARLSLKYEIFYNPNFSITHHLPERKSDWFRKMAYYGRAQSLVFLNNQGGVNKEKFLPLMFVVLLTCFAFLYPLVVQPILLISLLVPRLRFLLLSILFYGLGELVGIFLFLVKYKTLKKTQLQELT